MFLEQYHDKKQCTPKKTNAIMRVHNGLLFCLIVCIVIVHFNATQCNRATKITVRNLSEMYAVKIFIILVFIFCSIDAKCSEYFE